MPQAEPRDQAGRPPEPFRWVYKIRSLLMAPPVVFLAVCNWWEIETEPLTLGLGGAIFGLGLLLRVWSQVHLRYRLKSMRGLTRGGPYRYVRNPVYVGNILILLGCCLLSELVWFAPIMLLYALAVYHCVVRYEESHLLRKHGGDYEQFLRDVPRWVPRLPAGSPCDQAPTGQWIGPALIAEAHNLLLLVPFLAKEILS